MLSSLNSLKNLSKIILVVVGIVLFQSCSKDSPVVKSLETESYTAKHLTDYYTLVCKGAFHFFVYK